MTASTRWLSLLILFLGLCVTTEVRAQEPEGKKLPEEVQEMKDRLDEDNPNKAQMRRMKGKKASARQPSQPATSFLDVNNATVTLTRAGQYAFTDPFTGGNNSFPKGTRGATTFAQGFMFAGKVKDTTATDTSALIRAGGSTYFTGMKPGGLEPDGTPEDQTNREQFHVWRVHRNWEDQSVIEQSAAYRAGVNNPADLTDPQIQATREQYEYDWNNWPADDGAPFQDCNGNGTYEPAPPEAIQGGRTECEDLQDAGIDGDIPGKPKAAQTLWTVANDIGSASLDTDVSSVYNSPEIGVEVQYTVWGYARGPGTPLGNTAFHEATLIYKGKPDSHPHPTPDDARIDSMFISWWVDPDIGTFSNDFVGVDTSRSMAYAYNSGPQDGVFRALGQPPPAVGFDLLEGPTTTDGDTLGLTSFSFFAAGTEATDPSLFSYTGTLEWFNLMRGVLPQPPYPQSEPFINPITGQASKFANSGDPVSRTGWIDGVFVGPSDRRMAPNSGPFSMTVGDTVSVTVAQVNGQGEDFLQSIAVTRFFDNTAQLAFDSDFIVPTPPPSPQVTAAAGDQRVGLTWGNNEDLFRRTEDYVAPAGADDDAYRFQGYRVYQLPSPTAGLDEGKIVATFDEEDDVDVIRDQVFQPDAGTASEQITQRLPNEGVERHASFSRDLLNFEPLRNGNEYYYAVTAFGYAGDRAPDVPIRVQESPPTRVTVRPQTPPPSKTNVPQIDVGPNEAVQTDFTASGSPDTDVNVQVVLPDSVQTADYSITTSSSWSLERGGTEVVSDADFGDSRIVDGLAISVEDVSGNTGGDPTDDAWSFSTDGAQEADQQQRKSAVGNISVFPNPYRGFNELEDSRFDKFVRFTNLPSPEEGTTTIRIFTLSGNPVRIIRHDESSPNANFEDWDLKNEDGTFVSSGLYLVHVNTPFGEKELRLAIAMEEEIPRNY